MIMAIKSYYLIAMSFVMLCFSSSAFAAVYYVNNQAISASDVNPGTPDQPWLTMQHAADMVTAGDMVIVKPGVYAESVKLFQTGTAAAPITFKGESGAVLDGSSLDPYSNGFANFAFDPAVGYETFTMVDFIRIEGFEIRNFWRGVYAEPAVFGDGSIFEGGRGWVIQNNRIHDTYEGVSLWSGNAPEEAYVITGNYLYNNTWTDIHTHRYSIVQRNVTLSHAEEENIRSCTAYYLPGAVHEVSNNTLMNGTFGIQLAYPASRYTNNIIMNVQPRIQPWDGSLYGGFAFKNSLYDVDVSTVNISYDDLFNVADVVGDWTGPQSPPPTAVGMISADPLFVNNTGDHTGDYHLTAGSPCIDAGDPVDPVPGGGGSRIDIGAYEYGITIPGLIQEKHDFYAAGLIDNKGIVNSLDAKLNAAKASLARGHLKTARNQLTAFIHEAEAQAGKHVASGAARDLIEDATMILKSFDTMRKKSAP